MTAYRLREAAALLGVSDDTLRRWGAEGKLPLSTDDKGKQAIDGVALAEFAREQALAQYAALDTTRDSARNRFVGLVVNVVRDTVMAQVEMQCGPFRVVSLISREAADDLGLEPGMTAIATMKSTNVGIELPTGGTR